VHETPGKKIEKSHQGRKIKKKEDREMKEKKIGNDEKNGFTGEVELCQTGPQLEMEKVRTC